MGLKMKHKHADFIIEWANGAKVEMLHLGEWRQIDTPSWYPSVDYRIKPVPMPDIKHEVLITLSSSAGPLMYASQRSIESNAVLVFDGNTLMLKAIAFKQPAKPLEAI